VGQDLSPDLPAYVCYYLVVSAGLLVSFAKVDALLASSPRRWSHVRTWVIFFSYTLVPVLLFWLFDYTNALRDTSLFSALIVGFGYRQVLNGEYKTITPSNEVSKLWSPFEAWASNLRDAILAKNRSRSDALDARVRQHILGSETTPVPDVERKAALDRLISLAFVRAPDPRYFRVKLERARRQLLKVADLTPQPPSEQEIDEEEQLLKAADLIPQPPSEQMIPPEKEQPVGKCAGDSALQFRLQRQQVEFCLSTLRYAVLDGFENLLESHGLITAAEKDEIFERRLGRIIVVVGGTILTIIVVALPIVFVKTPAIDLFYQWRLHKSNVSEMDRYRAFEYLTHRANALDDPGPLLRPLISLLAFRGLDQRTTDDVLRLLLRCHPRVDGWAIPELIGMLRTENADTRTRVNDALLAFRALIDGTQAGVDDSIRKWKPSEADLPADIESHVQDWQKWSADHPLTKSSSASERRSPSPHLRAGETENTAKE
jgi:hypothetical protein